MLAPKGGLHKTMETQQQPEERQEPTTQPTYVLLRWVIAIGTALALLAIYVSTNGAASDERGSLEPSAIRLAQIYVEGAFYAILAIGAAFCGYIFTRWER